jgi:hypothetical protein
MLTRAFLLFLAMMTGLSAAQAADRSRHVAASQGMRLAAGQLLSDVQAERVERRVGLPLAALLIPKFGCSEQCDLFRKAENSAPAIAIHLSDRPRT